MRRPALLALIALAALPPLALAELPPRPGDESVNVHFTLLLRDADPGGAATERSVRLLALDGRRTRVSTGWRIPIPVTTFNRGGSESASGEPSISYQYQDVGLSASLEPRIVGERRVRVIGQVEVSSIDSEAAAAAGGGSLPRIGSFSHSFDLGLAAGEATPIAEVPKPAGGSLELRLTAAIGD